MLDKYRYFIPIVVIWFSNRVEIGHFFILYEFLKKSEQEEIIISGKYNLKRCSW